MQAPQKPQLVWQVGIGQTLWGPADLYGKGPLKNVADTMWVNA